MTETYDPGMGAEGRTSMSNFKAGWIIVRLKRGGDVAGSAKACSGIWMSECENGQERS
jgi:hypothetical protein